jgi:hypothetical protein
MEFHSGEVYQYSGVPEHVYQGLMRAASKGSYFRSVSMQAAQVNCL